jgi:N-acetyl-alpha-D-glucosaminyl L-malate synthase BshA
MRANDSMNIGMVCYPSVGGSGIVATELGKALADRGHRVHFLSSEPPFRLGGYHPGITFHGVHTPGYPLFREPQYLLTLANKIVQVSRAFGLDIIHAHYAIPHAAAAYLARQILLSTNHGKAPRVITTLHGTDITLLGSDPSYSETVAFCIDRSDGITAVSESLKRDTYRDLPVRGEIRVIHNFLDIAVHHRVEAAELRSRICPPAEFSHLVIHVSNFRPVKQVESVVRIFERIRHRVPAKLALVGDGPELGQVMRLVKDLGLGGSVDAMGEQDEIVPLLSASDVFLLPSRQESFGLAALEAMACEVPVVASSVGGLPEVIRPGIDGFLHPPEALDAMAESALSLLTDAGLHRRVADAGRQRVVEQFSAEVVVPRYEEYYRDVIARTA